MGKKVDPKHTGENITDAENEANTSGLLTAAETARMLKVHINTVRKWSNIGVLKCCRVGPRGDRRFVKEDVEKFLRG